MEIVKFRANKKGFEKVAGINKVILVGRLGKDPEVKHFTSGDAVCNFSIATSETWKDKISGEKKEKTEWHRIVAYRKLAEICAEYLSKGRQVYVEGRLQTRSWEKDGVTHYATEIVISIMQMLGDGGGGGRREEDRPKPTDWDSGNKIPEDDIPF